MSEQTRSLLYGAAIVVLAAVLTVLIVTSPSRADRVEQLGNSIKCPVCQGESIADSPSQMARDMMAVVDERVSQGWTDQQIIDELLSSYTGAVLLDPPASGSTLLLWLAPAVALMVGAGVIIWWRRHPGPERSSETDAVPKSRRRVLVGALVLSGAFAGIVVVAGFVLQDRQGPNSGVAALEEADLSEVSNETMEAVISANADDPRVGGMRLALAERYFEQGEYQAAFPHYMAVAESASSSNAETVTALIRLGWMAWESGAVEPALDMFDEALAVDPSSSTARYLKARVLWCGANDLHQAGEILAEVLAEGGLPEESLETVEADLQAVNSGEACR